MMRTSWWMAILTLALLALAGCGRPNTPRTRPPKEDPPKTPLATKMQNSTVRIADPKGKWTFEARSKTLDAPQEDGPYHLVAAHGLYEQPGRPPVKMTADRVTVDRKTEQLELRGSVRIESEGIVMEGERVAYNLKTGKVLALERTKWTLTRMPTASRTRSARPGD